MADKNIGSLPSIGTLNDDSLLVVEQQGAACKMTGRQFREFGEASVSEYVESARQSASAAAESAKSAADEVAKIGTAVEDSQAAAETAKAYSGNPPKPQGGTWWIWDADAGEYIDSGVSSVGPQGPPGASATINGENTLTIEAGENVSIAQEGGVLTLNAIVPVATDEEVSEMLDEILGPVGQ